MIDSNLEKPVHVKMLDAIQLTMFAAGVIELMRTAHPSLNSDSEMEHAKLSVLDLLDNIPPLLEHIEIHDEQDIPEVKCPVTGAVVQAAGDNTSEMLSFETSEAYVGALDDVELECVHFKDVELAQAWEDFIDATPPNDDYKELILMFVVYNYHRFRFMDLVLVETEHPQIGGMTTYTILDRSYNL